MEQEISSAPIIKAVSSGFIKPVSTDLHWTADCRVNFMLGNLFGIIHMFLK
jgi:hypothetical protein